MIFGERWATYISLCSMKTKKHKRGSLLKYELEVSYSIGHSGFAPSKASKAFQLDFCRNSSMKWGQIATWNPVEKLTYSPSQLLVLHGVSTSCCNMKLCVADHHAFSQSVGLMLLSTCARDADREAMCPFLTVVTRRKRWKHLMKWIYPLHPHKDTGGQCETVPSTNSELQ